MLESRAGVIVCEHVAELGLPVLRAVRDEPVRAEDSGWQFLCGGKGDEPIKRAKLWLVREILEAEPSLAPWLDAPVGTVLTRRDKADEWRRVV